MRWNPTIVSIPRAYVYGNFVLAVLWGFSIIHDLLIVMNYNGPYMYLRWLSLYYHKHSLDDVSCMDVLLTGGFQLSLLMLWWSFTVMLFRKTRSFWARLASLFLSLACLLLWLIEFGGGAYE